MVTRTSPNGVVPPELVVHIGHHFHPHQHATVGKEVRKCSGRWFCETDKTWIDGPKCEEK